MPAIATCIISKIIFSEKEVGVSVSNKLKELTVKDRFQGKSIRLNFAVKFYFAPRTGQSSTIPDVKLTGNSTIEIALTQAPYL